MTQQTSGQGAGSVAGGGPSLLTPAAQPAGLSPQAVQQLVDVAVQVALAKLLPRVSELETALVSHIAVATQGGPNNNHWANFYGKFKHLLGVAQEVNAVVGAVTQPLVDKPQ